MKRISALAITICAVLILVPNAFAQRSGVDFFVGYSNLQAEGLPERNVSVPFDTQFFRDRTTLHGANVSITGVPGDVFGITGDFSFNRKERREELPDGEDVLRTDVYYFVAGPSMSFRNNSRVEPFIRAMGGGAHTRFEALSRRNAVNGTNESSFEVGSTSFAMVVGGGLDVRVAENFKIRLFQVDYSPVFLRDRTVDVLGGAGVLQPQTLDGQRQDNLRFSFGVVF
jgi:opacity protein-like surface antigen